MTVTTPAALSVLDFCTIYEGETAAQSMARSVELAQRAEQLGFSRMWYTEHHNMPSIASSAPAVLISHIGAHTSRIRLGAGGVMLPNHAPYVIAEQFGTLAELYPDRIDLGVGRAPGTDMRTLGRALRRDSKAADRFPDDVQELQGYFGTKSPIAGVQAVPGANTNVPVYILGSSLFGASLAAQLGLPYAFASHFAPQHLEAAVSYYRDNYTPSAQHPEPYVIAGVNVTAAEEGAAEEFAQVGRQRVKFFAGRGRSEQQLDDLMASPQGQQILGMLKYAAVGNQEEVSQYLDQFQALAQADELMISLQSTSHAGALRSMELLARGWNL